MVLRIPEAGPGDGTHGVALMLQSEGVEWLREGDEEYRKEIQTSIGAHEVAEKVQELLESDPPNGAHVEARMTDVADGFLSPELPAKISSGLESACQEFYGNSSRSLFIGGTIPVMAMLQSRYPDSKFLITGAGGPGGNAHGPDEKLHIPTAKKVTKCMSAAVSAAIR